MNYYIAKDRFGNYDLCHYGIQGMRWGVRRFQDKSGRLTSAGKVRYGKDNKNAEDPRNDPHKRKGDLNELRELASVTAVSAATLAAQVAIAASSGMIIPHAFALSAVGTVAGGGRLIYRSIQAGAAAAKEALTNKRLANAPIDSETGYRKKTEEWSEIQDCKAINPGFKNFNSNTKNNCVLCSVAYDLRRRGYDVIAEKAGLGYTSEETDSFYKNAKRDRFLNSTMKDVMDRFDRRETGWGRAEDVKEMAQKATSFLNDQGVGARGLFSIRTTPTSGHCIAYEVTSKGPVFFDCQSGKKLSAKDVANMAIDMECVRTDNLKPDWDSIKKNGAVR